MSLDHLDLPYLPMEDAGFAANPYPYLAEVRKQHPWLARCAFGYVVHQYEAMHDLLWSDGSLSSAYSSIVDVMNARNTPWGDWTSTHVGAAQGETHKRMRDLLAPAFSPRQANENRALMREVVSALLDEWAPKCAFDFEEFASYFPISVMCTMVGASPSVVPSLRQSMEALGLSASMVIEHAPVLQAAFVQMDAFVQDLTARRRAGERLRPERDLLDDLITAADSGQLSSRELYDLLVFIFIAGYDTSKNVLTYTMSLLIDRPEIYARCAWDWDYCSKVTEEALRFFNPGTIPRFTSKDISYRDVSIPAGVSLFFPVSIASRDPSAFDDPDRFDPERIHEKRHMAFGRGAHICLGQFIARAQIHEGLHLIAQRIKNPQRVGASGVRPFFGVWGIRGLPIVCTPGARSEQMPH